MNKYKIAYSIYDETKPAEVQHKEFEFESDGDLLGAADEGMTHLYTEFAAGKEFDILFRSIELLNARDVYKLIIKQARERNAENSS